MGPISVGSNHSHICPNVCAKFGRGPTVVSEKRGYRQTHGQLFIVDVVTFTTEQIECQMRTGHCYVKSVKQVRFVFNIVQA